jgi:hypothetical protein
MNVAELIAVLQSLDLETEVMLRPPKRYLPLKQ